MLEDESGRIPLVGDLVHKAKLVTGVILGALGRETANSEFEVVDICYAGYSPSELLEGSDDKMKVDGTFGSRPCGRALPDRTTRSSAKLLEDRRMDSRGVWTGDRIERVL